MGAVGGEPRARRPSPFAGSGRSWGAGDRLLIADLRAVVHTVMPVNVTHQKISVIDEQTVMISSLNTLSQSYKAGANGRSDAWNQDIRFSNGKR
ncbi:hypothetical protein [Streptomyces melanogenes]|uniref:hypothetical protein n=1 Tax=Streptomyces melanogenes TaxID=67326 RepID=UPI001E60B6D8|nr:hypothetical protein [Streptomyces melanogenes]